MKKAELASKDFAFERLWTFQIGINDGMSYRVLQRWSVARSAARNERRDVAGCGDSGESERERATGVLADVDKLGYVGCTDVADLVGTVEGWQLDLYPPARVAVEPIRILVNPRLQDLRKHAEDVALVIFTEARALAPLTPRLLRRFGKFVADEIVADEVVADASVADASASASAFASASASASTSATIASATIASATIAASLKVPPPPKRLPIFIPRFFCCLPEASDFLSELRVPDGEDGQNGLYENEHDCSYEEWDGLEGQEPRAIGSLCLADFGIDYTFNLPSQSILPSSSDLNGGGAGANSGEGDRAQQQVTLRCVPSTAAQTSAVFALTVRTVLPLPHAPMLQLNSRIRVQSGLLLPFNRECHFPALPSAAYVLSSKGAVDPLFLPSLLPTPTAPDPNLDSDSNMKLSQPHFVVSPLEGATDRVGCLLASWAEAESNARQARQTLQNVLQSASLRSANVLIISDDPSTCLLTLAEPLAHIVKFLPGNPDTKVPVSLFGGNYRLAFAAIDASLIQTLACAVRATESQRGNNQAPLSSLRGPSAGGPTAGEFWTEKGACGAHRFLDYVDSGELEFATSELGLQASLSDPSKSVILFLLQPSKSLRRACARSLTLECANDENLTTPKSSRIAKPTAGTNEGRSLAASLELLMAANAASAIHDEGDENIAGKPMVILDIVSDTPLEDYAFSMADELGRGRDSEGWVPSWQTIFPGAECVEVMMATATRWTPLAVPGLKMARTLTCHSHAPSHSPTGTHTYTGTQANADIKMGMDRGTRDRETVTQTHLAEGTMLVPLTESTAALVTPEEYIQLMEGNVARDMSLSFADENVNSEGALTINQSLNEMADDDKAALFSFQDEESFKESWKEYAWGSNVQTIDLHNLSHILQT